MSPLMYLICHFVADYLSFLLSLCFYEMHNEGADIARSAPPHRLTRPTGKLDPDCMVGASLAPTALQTTNAVQNVTSPVSRLALVLSVSARVTTPMKTVKNSPQ